MKTYIDQIKNSNTTIKKNIIAADFETFLHNKEHIVYAIGYYEKNSYKMYYLEENLNDNEIKEKSLQLIEKFILNLKLDRKKKYIYFHNLGSFDGIFILDTITKSKFLNKKNFSTIIRNNKIYKITIENLHFLDSQLLINDTLNNIAKTLLNKEKVEINFEHTNNYKKCIKNKKFISKYLFNDVILLNDIIETLNKRFIKLYNVDITKNFTLPSLAFHIYRKLYMKHKIYISTGYKYDFIKKSYIGGLTNVTQPTMNKGFSYDINSLYPFIMKTKKLPIEKPEWIYNENIENVFGFIDCTIFVPDNLIIPPLSIKLKGTLVQPTGTFRSTFFTEEIKNAIKKYNCKIIKTHKILNFQQKEVLFEDYINDMYTNRMKSTNKTDNLIYKLLMNTLYGRFGMNQETSITKIIDKEKLPFYQLLFDITDYHDNSELLTFKYNKQNSKIIKEEIDKINLDTTSKENILKELEIFEKRIGNTNSSIQIASAITSYARIKLINDMNDHIINNNSEIYYYDTDSIYTNKKLDNELTSDNLLGKYKLEKIIKKGIFLSPKNYAIIDEKNKETIKFKGLYKSEIKNINFDKFKTWLNNEEKPKWYTYKPIYKTLKNLKIQDKTIKFEPSFESKKYNKIFLDNIWIKNKNIKLNKEYTKN